MSNVKIVAKIRYSVEGDLYGKIIFIQDGEYWADDQNYGDDPLEEMTEKDFNECQRIYDFANENGFNYLWITSANPEYVYELQDKYYNLK